MTSDELKLAAEYDRGYTDGKKAKSADEWRLARDREDVVRRLREIKLDGGSHANLSEICKCVYHTDEWTPSACVGLRDELISLLGGDTDQHAFVGYDVLGNERHKAVCELRKLKLGVGSLANNQICIADAIGAEFNEGDNFSKVMQARLIHLLGGDERNFSTAENNTRVLMPWDNPAETSKDASDHVSLNTRITSELRDAIQPCMDDDWLTIERAAFDAIADRIDAQFSRICEQQESVLQAAIGQMCDERDKLQAVIDLKDRALDAALAKLKDSIEPPKDRDGKTWHLGDEFVYEGNPVEVDALCLYDGEWMLQSDLYSTQFNAAECAHAPTATAESIVRDLTLGRITEQEAVELIEELRNE